MRKYSGSPLALAALAILMSGCASQILEDKSFRSYSVGETKTATIGEAFLVDQAGNVKRVRRWVGILASPDGWETKDEYSQDYLRRELLYSGKSGNVIKVSYREFRGGYAAPAFFQNLEYDLNESRTIKFRRFTLDIRDANNQSITYTVVSDQ